jgi:hypothetical protein
MAFSQSAHSRLNDCTFNDVGRDQIRVSRVTIVNHGLLQITNEQLAILGVGDRLAPTSASLSLIPKSSSSLVLSIVDTATNLVVTIVDMLRAERLVQSHQLECQLNSLSQSIALTGLAIKAYEFTSLGDSLAKTVYPEMEGCRSVLQETLNETKRYQETLRSTRISGLWSKVWWSGLDVEKLASYGKTLRTRQDHLDTLLRALNSCVFRPLNTSSTR